MNHSVSQVQIKTYKGEHTMPEIWIPIGIVAFVLLAVILVYISKYKTVNYKKYAKIMKSY